MMDDARCDSLSILPFLTFVGLTPYSLPFLTAAGIDGRRPAV